ncbi:hypothetical protein TNCV_762871 [Trichonephila clavipes]|nr:hypothetical protein TNCV_762871 [Trichonephila clavipes]
MEPDLAAQRILLHSYYGQLFIKLYRAATSSNRNPYGFSHLPRIRTSDPAKHPYYQSQVAFLECVLL